MAKAPEHEHDAPAKEAAPKMKKKEKLNDKKIVATRAARAGDAGYQLSTVDEQVTAILEDGSELVVKPVDLLEPEKPAR